MCAPAGNEIDGLQSSPRPVYRLEHNLSEPDVILGSCGVQRIENMDIRAMLMKPVKLNDLARRVRDNVLNHI